MAQTNFLTHTNTILRTSLTALFCALTFVSAAQSNQRPNVVIIISDDHRHDWMGHKNSLLQTPNLDSLAEEGWSLPNVFVNAGVCSPSRASFLTGKYMHQASVPDIDWSNNSFLRTQTMFPKRLKEAGYKTGYIGKFHLGEEQKPKEGFDLWASFEFVGSFFDQNIWINGEEKEMKGFTDDNIAEFAAQTIEDWSKSDQPFCLIIGLKSPHIPFTYPDRMKSLYADTKFPEPETFYFDYSDSKPGMAKNLINAREWQYAIPSYGSFQEWVRSYTRLATTIDESVGTVVGAMKKSGIYNESLFLYTSDHGYSLGEFNMCEKHYPYEQVMRIPMVAHFPDQPATGPPTDMLLLMDVGPTVLDYCHVPIPKEMEGKSWRPLMEPERKSDPFREAVFFDFWHNAREILPPMQAVRTEKYKLIDYEYQPYKELYDLEKDPLEKVNLIENDEYKAVRKKLEKHLQKWKKSTDWVARGKHEVEKIYVAESPGTLNPSVSDVLDKKGKWKPVHRKEGSFSLAQFTPGQSYYLAIPLKNGSNYDPYMNLRILDQGDKKPKLSYLGYHQGENIYSSLAWKHKNGIETVSFRSGFDRGYNPPLSPGNNVILIKVDIDESTPKYWDISIVGGIEKVDFL